MAESEGIQAVVNQVVVQVMTAVMMALRDTDVGPRILANTAKERHGILALQKPSFI